jgi:hypothetical protein
VVEARQRHRSGLRPARSAHSLFPVGAGAAAASAGSLAVGPLVGRLVKRRESPPQALQQTAAVSVSGTSSLTPAAAAAELCQSAAEVMLHVRQRYTFDCGVAVVATLARVSYDAVLDRLITGLSSGSPLREIVVWRCLEDITQASWCMEHTRNPRPQFAAYPFQDAPAAALIQRADGARHYVAVCDGLVYDPLFEVPVGQSEYPDRSAWVVTVFRPKSEAGRTALWPLKSR